MQQHDNLRIPSDATGCFCFSLCSEYDARSFHLRLPSIINTNSSPWFTYLEAVYNEPPALPVTLAAFEFFYLRLLPVEWVCDGRIRSLKQWCASEVCSRWLTPFQPTSADLAAHEQHWHLRDYQWHRSRLPALLFNHTLRFLPRVPRPTLFHHHRTHVEVVRHSHGFTGWDGACSMGHGADSEDWIGDPTFGAAEGVGYGCWFTPSVGTGIWLTLDRALVLPDRAAIEVALPDVLRFPTRVNYTWLNAANETVLVRHRDCAYANATRNKGFNELVTLMGPHGAAEIVVATHGCMNQRSPLPNACPPLDVELHTGWNGRRTCSCSQTPDGGYASALNCAGYHHEPLQSF